jgi:hypothetical protein
MEPSMKSDDRLEYVTRDSLLKLLSDEELARVSMAETATLADGDEYIDLHHLGHGVRMARGVAPLMAGVLPRKAVTEGTWTKLVASLPLPPIVTATGPARGTSSH